MHTSLPLACVNWWLCVIKSGTPVVSITMLTLLGSDFRTAGVESMRCPQRLGELEAFLYPVNGNNFFAVLDLRGLLELIMSTSHSGTAATRRMCILP